MLAPAPSISGNIAGPSAPFAAGFIEDFFRGLFVGFFFVIKAAAPVFQSILYSDANPLKTSTPSMSISIGHSQSNFSSHSFKGKGFLRQAS